MRELKLWLEKLCLESEGRDELEQGGGHSGENLKEFILDQLVNGIKKVV